MVSADAETDLAVSLEASRRGREAEARRAQRIGLRQNDPAVIQALGIGAVGRSAQREVPFEEV
jgi:hypothetical protein